MPAADTANELVVPEYVIEEAGWIVMVGGVLTITVAFELVTLAEELETTT